MTLDAPPKWISQLQGELGDVFGQSQLERADGIIRHLQGRAVGESDASVHLFGYGRFKAAFLNKELDDDLSSASLFDAPAVRWAKRGPRIETSRYFLHLFYVMDRRYLTEGQIVELRAGLDLGDVAFSTPLRPLDDGFVGEMRSAVEMLWKRSLSLKARTQLADRLLGRVTGNAIAIPLRERPGSLKPHYLFKDVEAALCHTLYLLANLDASLGARLSRCSYRECSRFFLKELNGQPGRPPIAYCCEAHRAEERRLRSVESSRTYRENHR